MSTSTTDDPKFCVAGLIFFEVYLPPESTDVPLGREILVDDIDVGVGGALNPASVAAALDIDTTVAHPRGGGPTDAATAAELDRLDLDSRTWTATDDPAISLVRSESGDRGFVTRADYDALAEAPTLDAFDWIHVPGLEEAHRLDAQLRRARSSKTTVSVAGSWAPERLDALTTTDEPHWDLLIVNSPEAQRATAETTESTTAMLAELTAAATDVIITDGPRAVYARLGEDNVEHRVPDIDDIVDATGAGDAFGAGYIAARLQGSSRPDAIEAAIDVAARVVQIHGGVIRNPEFFDQQLSERG